MISLPNHISCSKVFFAEELAWVIGQLQEKIPDLTVSQFASIACSFLDHGCEHLTGLL